jgi:hypothetical protein
VLDTLDLLLELPERDFIRFCSYPEAPCNARIEEPVLSELIPDEVENVSRHVDVDVPVIKFRLACEDSPRDFV